MTPRKYLGLMKVSFSEVPCPLTIVLLIRKDGSEMALQVFFFSFAGTQACRRLWEAVLPSVLRTVKGLGDPLIRTKVPALPGTSCVMFLNVSRLHFLL